MGPTSQPTQRRDRRVWLTTCAPGMAHDLQGESPFNHLSGGRFSEGQRRRREAGSEGSPEQNADPTNRNRIRGTGAG